MAKTPTLTLPSPPALLTCRPRPKAVSREASGRRVGVRGAPESQENRK